MIDFEAPGRAIARAVVRLVRNAMQPILWVFGIAAVGAFSLAALLRDQLPVVYLLIGFAAVPLLVACYGFIHLLKHKPELLQSEHYRLQQQAMTIVELKGGPIDVDRVSLEEIVTPHRRLGAGEAKGELAAGEGHDAS